MLGREQSFSSYVHIIIIFGKIYVFLDRKHKRNSERDQWKMLLKCLDCGYIGLVECS